MNDLLVVQNRIEPLDAVKNVESSCHVRTCEYRL
jgi:hypothetical protein